MNVMMKGEEQIGSKGIDCLCEACGLEFTWILDGIKGPYDDGCCSDHCARLALEGGRLDD
jgi:hypothetical protein